MVLGYPIIILKALNTTSLAAYFNSNSLDFEKFSLSSIASKTCKRPYKVKDCISTRPISSTLSKLLLPLFGDLDKLASAQALFSKPFNILAVAFASSEAPLKVYTNEDA